MLRIESLLFRLLKAVLIPITIKYFGRPLESVKLNSSDMGEPLSIDSCAALAAAKSISRFEIVFSSVLYTNICAFIRNQLEMLGGHFETNPSTIFF